MSNKSRRAISPSREENYPEWYQQVVRAADLAENSAVRGCMVIKPWGFALWENLQSQLDAELKKTGHLNAYFPLFIPISFFEKEAGHVEGFAKECAVVTHHRLSQDATGGLGVDPEAVLDEPLIVRPTSETIIGATFAKWIQSYRDLPLLINQWANVVRWELRPRLFLRTTEFLWQEGHTAHATEEEALEETLRIVDLYTSFVEGHLAIPLIKGRKTESERFPGAIDTYTIEAMMQDRKALQAGTSHFLGQNFARASDIVFQSKEGVEEHVWTTSWGVTTRLIGGLVMTHGDDDGVRLPPRVAPKQVIVLPILGRGQQEGQILERCHSVAEGLQTSRVFSEPVSVFVDDRDRRGGEKQWEWIKKGAPIRIELGPRDLEQDVVTVMRRDRPRHEKEAIPLGRLNEQIPKILEDIQSGLFQRALDFREKHTQALGSWDEFVSYFTPRNREEPEIHGGFAVSAWCGEAECEARVKDALKVTIRCLPLKAHKKNPSQECVVCGQPKRVQAIFAKSY